MHRQRHHAQFQHGASPRGARNRRPPPLPTGASAPRGTSTFPETTTGVSTLAASFWPAKLLLESIAFVVRMATAVLAGIACTGRMGAGGCGSAAADPAFAPAVPLAAVSAAAAGDGFGTFDFSLSAPPFWLASFESEMPVARVESRSGYCSGCWRRDHWYWGR